MTSAIMLLNYHGYDRGYGLIATNPWNMNQYLKAETFPPPPAIPHVKGFDQDGGFVWSSFTEYADEASNSGAAKKGAPKLEFGWPDYNLELIRQDTENGQPVIVEIVMDDKGDTDSNNDTLHFVVAKGVTEDDKVLIEDPWDLTETT